MVDVKNNIVCTISKYGYGFKSTSIILLIRWTLQIISMIYVYNFVLSTSYVFAAYLRMRAYISIGCSRFGKNCNVTVDMSKNVHSYVISHNSLKIYEFNII